MKIRRVGAELFHADGGTDGRTDKMKLTIASCNFVHESKNFSNFYKILLFTVIIIIIIIVIILIIITITGKYYIEMLRN